MSHEEPNLTPAERELADAMSRLNLARAGLDPLAVAYDAGRASGRRALVKWKAAAAVLLLGLGGALVLPRQSAPAPVIVTVNDPPVTPHDTQLASYFSIRNNVLARGISALPENPVHREPASPLRAGGGSL